MQIIISNHTQLMPLQGELQKSSATGMSQQLLNYIITNLKYEFN